MCPVSYEYTIGGEWWSSTLREPAAQRRCGPCVPEQRLRLLGVKQSVTATFPESMLRPRSERWANEVPSSLGSDRLWIRPNRGSISLLSISALASRADVTVPHHFHCQFIQVVSSHNNLPSGDRSTVAMDSAGGQLGKFHSRMQPRLQTFCQLVHNALANSQK